MSQTTVRVTIKVVKNLGNFESLHMEAGVETPLKDGESFDEGFNRVYDAVERNLGEKISDAVQELKSIK
jgi:hypothetical protein